MAILLKSFFFIFSHQYTPLSVAAEKNHVDTVKCLIDNGADVNVCDENRVREWNYTAILYSLFYYEHKLKSNERKRQERRIYSCRMILTHSLLMLESFNLRKCDCIQMH